ncbi:hypothetical protein CRYUN_Cryun09bG0041800 [Craigia yunnanensis]
MENSSSKAEVIKPVLLKAGIPIALSPAGVIYAKIIAKRRINPGASSIESPVSPLETYSLEEFRGEGSLNSTFSTCGEDEEQIGTIIHFMNLIRSSEIQKTCPSSGSIEVPYPLSTHPNCGDPGFSLRCDSLSQKLYFDALNGSSYLVTRIMVSFHRMVVQPSPWVPGKCVTQDMPCASGLDPCCTFIAGGMPSAYKIRLHSKGCKAFRSILHLDPEKPAYEWEEGLEIQWAPPPEPVCQSQPDCSEASKCSPAGANGLSRCLCSKGYNWDPVFGTCLRKKKNTRASVNLKVSIGVISFFILALATAAITFRKSWKNSKQAKLMKAREDMLKSNNGGKPAKMFRLKEVKKATRDRFLGSGGFGEVNKGELPGGAVVAIKSAKVGNIKSVQQVLNEVGILSQVNHKNLVRLLGCCVEVEQPLMIYEYISNGTLHDHLHGKYSTFLDWKTRVNIALQTAEALAYLHSAVYTPIYHRDVKSTNILLDDDFNAKVSDFGLSRLASPGLSHVSTCAQGTLGYMDPEYYRNYQLTDKSDVYSYGVVLLELLTSQRAIDFSRDQDDVNLAIYVSQRASNGAIMEVWISGYLVRNPQLIW